MHDRFADGLSLGDLAAFAGESGPQPVLVPGGGHVPFAR